MPGNNDSNEEPPRSAPGCIFSLFWALASLPFWIAALVLIAVAVTVEGRLFAFAVLCLLPVPLNLLHWKSRPRRWVTLLLLVAGLSALIACYIRSPRYEDNPESAARLLYQNDTRHARLSPANLVPEVDQHLLGSYLFSLIDSHLDWNQAAQLREHLKKVYGDLEQDHELAALPSALGFAYEDLLLGRRKVGNLFLYLPPGDAPKPVILFLHGSMGNFQGYWQIWKTFADQYDVAIVAPTFGAGNWSQPGGLKAIELARAFCLKNPRLDAGRIILAGVSNGGSGVSRAAAEKPAAWYGLVLLSPVLEKSVLDTPEFKTGWRGRPVLLISGEKDRRIPAAHLRTLEKSITDSAVRVESHYLPGEDHFLAFPAWPAVRKLIVDWMRNEEFLPTKIP